MKISVLTMFPQMFDSFLESPLVQRALKKQIAEIEIMDIKEHVQGSYRDIDESPYGGGNGMVIRCDAVLPLLAGIRTEQSHVIALTPAGNTFVQKTARQMMAYDHLILIAGHYEGLDQRIIEEADECISIGDYVLSGGELPAMVMIDSLIRLKEGILREGSPEDESFENDRLEYPQYTKPAVYEGKEVPSVLLSGNHEKIRTWRKKESLRMTMRYRPDLLEKREPDEEEQEFIKQISHE